MRAWRRVSRAEYHPPPPLPGGPDLVLAVPDGQHGHGYWTLAPLTPSVWRLEHKVNAGAWVFLANASGEADNWGPAGSYSGDDHVQWRIRGDTPAGTPVTLWSYSNVVVIPPS